MNQAVSLSDLLGNIDKILDLAFEYGFAPGGEERFDIFGIFAKPPEIVGDQVVIAAAVTFDDDHALVISALADALGGPRVALCARVHERVGFRRGGEESSPRRATQGE